jgi:hypothetical protein
MTTWARALLVAVVVLVGACGDDEAPARPAERVDVALVPPTLAGGDLVLHEDDKAKDAFASLNDNALIADGKLFAIRRGERLVATLQLSTLVPEVDLTDRDRRDEMIDKLLPGVKDELRIGEISVFQVAGDDKVAYVWFGAQMFQVLQVKGSAVDPEDVLGEIVAFQLASPAWHPLTEAEEEF